MADTDRRLGQCPRVLPQPRAPDEVKRGGMTNDQAAMPSSRGAALIATELALSLPDATLKPWCASSGLPLVTQDQKTNIGRSKAAAIRLMPRLYATSTQASPAFPIATPPIATPVRTVMAWAPLRSAANDTGSMAPKECKENTEGVSEYPAGVASVARTGADLRSRH